MLRLLRIVLLGTLAALLAAASGVFWISSSLHRPFAGWSGEEKIVLLPKNAGAGAMLEQLARERVIRRPLLVRVYATFQGWDRSLRAGEYRFDHAASALDVLARLRQGDVLLHPVTIPEGQSLEETADTIATLGFVSAQELAGAFRDPAPIRAFDPLATDLEGYLFPDTYFFPRDEPPAAIARTMVRRFLEVAGPSFAQRAQAAGLTPRRALVLASLIEKETALPAERPRVSGVFHNRLKRNMLLQCDPTVLYALRRAGRSVAKLARADLAFSSPWNTYVSAGLPPGPICNPGRESLEAALTPAGDDLYFVAAPGGGHRFSSDLAAHEQAVRVWRSYERSSR